MTTAKREHSLADTDMDIMRILHDGFRRDAVRLESAAERYGTQSERTHAALLLGWRSFSFSLKHHHTVEDRYIWPVIRGKLADRPEDRAVLDAMETEHSYIDPSIESIEHSFADPDAGVDEVAGHISAFVALLRSHLAHEESDAFPLIRTLITRAEWDRLNKAALKSVSLADIAQLGPWMLEGRSAEDVRRVLEELPPPLRLVYRLWWNPRYVRGRRWE